MFDGEGGIVDDTCLITEERMLMGDCPMLLLNCLSSETRICKSFVARCFSFGRVITRSLHGEGIFTLTMLIMPIGVIQWIAYSLT